MDEFLALCDMTEYSSLFHEKNVITMDDLLNITESDIKQMKVKFGHRKKIIELLCSMDCLYDFLQKAGLIEHYKRMKELGFDSVWSLMGIEESYREKLGFSEEEMKKVMEAKTKLVESKKGELEKTPELADLSENASSKPILSLLFSDEKAKELMEVGNERRSEA